MEFTILNSLFYAFASLVLFSALMVVSAKNPVHSVLFLIFAFFNAAGLLVLLGVEYIAMTLVIVYVGAVAVLFLFVVMMLDVDFEQWRSGFVKYLPAGIVVAIVLLTQLGSILYAGYISSSIQRARKPGGYAIEQTASVTNKMSSSAPTNAESIGYVLYTDYAYVFILAGLVLLVAMIGAIVLTLRHQASIKRQNISKQLARKREESVGLVQVESGKGVPL